jgi:hypothetical protein
MGHAPPFSGDQNGLENSRRPPQGILARRVFGSPDTSVFPAALLLGKQEVVRAGGATARSYVMALAAVVSLQCRADAAWKPAVLVEPSFRSSLSTTWLPG